MSRKNATVRNARTRLRRIAYQVGAVGGLEMVYSITTDRTSGRRYATRAGSYGRVTVRSRHPAYVHLSDEH